MAAQIPLVESGTAGYLGQVQPLLKVDPTILIDHVYQFPSRIILNALIVYQNQHQKHFQCVRFVQLQVSQSTVLYGAKAISWGNVKISCQL